MSGFCGWFGGDIGPDESRRRLAAMSAALTEPDGSETESASGEKGAVAAAVSRRECGGAGADGPVQAAIEGQPVWIDPVLSAIAERVGHGQALVQGYKTRGDKIVEAITGSFRLVVLDSANDRALLATDRLGRHPIVYATVGNALLFASSGNALRAHPDAPSGVDSQALYEYLYFAFVPAPRTVRKDQHRLRPAEILTFENGTVSRRVYWRPDYRDAGTDASFENLKEEFLELLSSAVSASLASARCGCFLSGGVDSSTVAGLAKAAGGSVRTYSIGFAAKGYDEMEYARISSRHFGTDHHEYYVTPADVVEAVPKIARMYAEPFGNESAVPTYFCARMAKEDGVERLLAGDGGDELFAGNSRYAQQKVYDAYHRVPAFLRTALIEPILSAFPLGDKIMPVRKGRSYVRQANVPLPKRLEAYNYFERFGAGTILEEEFLRTIDLGGPLAALEEEYAAARSDASLNRMLHSDLRFVLADCDLVKVSRMCEMAGVEVAFPLLADELVEFASRVPAKWKIKGLKLRWFMKEALRDLLAPSVLTKTKQGFGLPFGLWLKDDPGLEQLAGDSLSDLKARGVVRASFIDDVRERHRSEHAKYYGVMVWRLMMLEQWFKAHQDTPVQANLDGANVDGVRD
ncbi:MAG: asparagine synthase-related protein [Planctomycetota bacterium]